MPADAQFWNKLAERYAAKPVDDVPAFRRKIEHTKRRLRPDDVVLEFGCGTGSLALELSPHVAHIHAIDISKEMIRIANDKATAAQAKNVTFYEGGLERLEQFEPGTIDMVCAYSILHLMPDPQQTAERLVSRLKPGGHFVSSTVCLGASWVPYSVILPVMRWLGQAPAVTILRQRELIDALEAAGLHRVSALDVGVKPEVAFVVAERPEHPALPADDPADTAPRERA